jgi:hypothetical protein
MLKMLEMLKEMEHAEHAPEALLDEMTVQCKIISNAACRKAVGAPFSKWDVQPFLEIYKEFPLSSVEIWVQETQRFLDLIKKTKDADKIKGLIFLTTLVALGGNDPVIVSLLRTSGFKIPLVSPHDIVPLPSKSKEILARVARNIDMNPDHLKIFMDLKDGQGKTLEEILFS